MQSMDIINMILETSDQITSLYNIDQHIKWLKNMGSKDINPSYKTNQNLSLHYTHKILRFGERCSRFAGGARGQSTICAVIVNQNINFARAISVRWLDEWISRARLNGLKVMYSRQSFYAVHFNPSPLDDRTFAVCP